jgi:hypothetical protein
MRLKQNVQGVAAETREQTPGTNCELYVYDK